MFNKSLSHVIITEFTIEDTRWVKIIHEKHLCKISRRTPLYLSCASGEKVSLKTAAELSIVMSKINRNTLTLLAFISPYLHHFHNSVASIHCLLRSSNQESISASENCIFGMVNSAAVSPSPPARDSLPKTNLVHYRRHKTLLIVPLKFTLMVN